MLFQRRQQIMRQGLIAELARRNIDRQAQSVESGGMPLGELSQSRLDHEGPDPVDQTDVLGQRDELGGGDIPKYRMLPA